MDKGLEVPKKVLKIWPQIPQIPQSLFGRSAQLAQNFGILLKKASSGVRSPWFWSHCIWPLRAKLEIA